MTIRRRARVVWLVLVTLLAVVAALEYRDVMASRAARAPADPRALLPVPLARIGAIEIADAGTRHRFERDDTGAWFYHGAHGGADGVHTHTPDAATAARIEQVLQAFARTRIERQLPAGTDPRPYGLTAPRTLVLVYRKWEVQPLAQYAVGDVAPDTVSRYVDVVGAGRIVTIPGYQVDNLLQLVAAVRAAPARR